LYAQTKAARGEELSPELAAQLPASSPDAPWALGLDAILWMHGAAPGAAEFVPAALRGRRQVPFTVGGFVRYAETPVGPYNEVWGSPVGLLHRGLTAATVPFMVVDSLASIHGGRSNWSLPKSLGTFAWESDTTVRADGESPAGPWSVSAVASPKGPAIPFWGPSWLRQLTPGGEALRIGARGRGMARMATVRVETTGPSLPEWLLPGEHVGLVIRRARMRFGPAKRRG
ncbi:MAG: acetoacetate decarboxylase family protein, partial [Solirubrobacteraceae bacterium]|nr:acetoacetate decarboxylase family protein [Solirubrobacteraceae bacterium]